MYDDKIKQVSPFAIADAIRIAKSLVPAGLRNNPWAILDHGCKILSTEDELNCYMAAYGEMHRAKAFYALSAMPFDELNKSVEIVDYGCGQGLASMCFIEKMREGKCLPRLRKITLIEPSGAALQRAKNNLRQALRDARDCEIVALEQFLPSATALDDEVKSLDVKCNIVVHLFSNVLDIATIDLKRTASLVSSSGQRNYVICVGPNNLGAHRIDCFTHYLNPDTRDIFLKKTAPILGYLEGGKSYGCAVTCFRTRKSESMFRAYRVSAYDHPAEQEQFDDICRLLEERYGKGKERCILFGNINIEGVELDALLFAPGMIRILEFKNWGGSIVATENGPWLAGNKIIAGGASGKTPFQQARVNRSRVVQGLEKRTHVRYPNVSVAIIFRQDSDIDISELSDPTRKWLSVCDNAHLEEILRTNGNVDINNDTINQMPQLLKIDKLGGDDASTGSVEQQYMTEAEDFFHDIEMAIGFAPDYQRVYRCFDEVFHSVLSQKTASKRGMFQGAFAQTDYLLKENGADVTLIRAVNDLRVRLNKKAQGLLGDNELEQYCFTDMKALCDFVSLVYKVSIPTELAVMYSGKTAAPSKRVLPKSDYIRVSVRNWDDNYIYGTSEDGDGVEEVRICYSTDYYNNDYIDWVYLRDMLYEGSSINVVTPIERDGIIYASFIIFEPDYLVNVQTVASCFTEYADSPMVSLINKLKPSPISGAITLGNFAGQLLDESLSELPMGHSYNSSIKDFYKNYWSAMLDLGDFQMFYTEGAVQKENIDKAVNETLPSLHKEYDKKDGIVEPSFFSEMLGLQGRMDYLQHDFKLLLEQKSGKGEWPYDNYIKPNKKKEHYIQLLLYMLIIRYNYHAVYAANKEELHAYLLYSKYKEPLEDCHFSPKQVQQAIKIRNGIANLELQCSKEGGFDLLINLKSEDLNEKETMSKLWAQYQRPEMEKILCPIQNASDLERSYFLRFLTFISQEHLLSKLGNKAKECSGFSSAWHDSLEAKLAAGNIYANLQLINPEVDEHGSVRTIKLKYSENKDNVMSNFRKGDIVVLYPYEPGKTPDLRTTMVFRSTIARIDTDTVTLKLRAPQSERAFNAKKGCIWAFEHDFMESSYSSLYKGMHAFLTASKERRDLILLQREPGINPEVELKGDYGYFNDLVLRVKRAKDLFLIIGPPGTGKTSFGMLYNVKEELLSNDSSILLLAYTNRAVDEICGKLEKEDIDYIRIGTEENCDEAYKDRLLSTIASNTAKVLELKEKIISVRVIVSTAASINSRPQILTMKAFSLCIVDEASQILEPHLMGILAAREGNKPSIEKIVLIGDEKQLPAIVQQSKKTSAVTESTLNDIYLTNCRDSLFERLLRRYGDDPSVTYVLSRQGRMHEVIARFSSEYFYNNKLEVASDRQKEDLPPTTEDVKNPIEKMLLSKRVIFIDANPPKESESKKVNDVEADIIARCTLLAYKHEGRENFIPDETIGIIVPYRNQIATIRNAIAKFAKEDKSLTEKDITQLDAISIDTVERFQGSQRKYIIYSFTVQWRYQLKFLTDSTFIDKSGKVVDRKLNVVITRAEEHLIMVGNSPLLTNVPLFREVIDFVYDNDGYIDLRTPEVVPV